MGTRADFYVASGDDRMNLELEYLGTISSDGSEIDDVGLAETEYEFRRRCAILFAERRGGMFPRVNSFNTDHVFVFVDGLGVIERHEDLDNLTYPDSGEGIYVSLQREHALHEKGKASADEDTGEYTIPEWDSFYGFQNAARVEGIRYRYPDNSQSDALVRRPATLAEVEANALK